MSRGRPNNPDLPRGRVAYDLLRYIHENPGKRPKDIKSALAYHRIGGHWMQHLKDRRYVENIHTLPKTEFQARSLEELRELWLPHRDHSEITVSCFDSTGFQQFRLAEGAAIEFMNTIVAL